MAVPVQRNSELRTKLEPVVSWFLLTLNDNDYADNDHTNNAIVLSADTFGFSYEFCNFKSIKSTKLIKSTE